MICPACHEPLAVTADALCCPTCHARHPVVDGIADFSGGDYYDRFTPTDTLAARDVEGLALEVDGARRRIVDFYEPLLRREGVHRVLDSGCGNGLSVDLLAERGYEAWGNDLSQLRRFQWRERRWRERLVVASSLRLPFPDGYFDAVISSGVIEHIGVVETGMPRYAVRPLPNRDEQRGAFLAELFRVTRPGGVVFLDFPNGAFPIDFWHGDDPGGARRHALDEGFLPTAAELRLLVRRVLPAAHVALLSPFRRLQFHQSRRHWYGRILGPFASVVFALLRYFPFRLLAGTAVNPFLVVRIRIAGPKP